MLASQGVKKTQAEKALDALAEKGKVMRKEFGKTKIYFTSQEGLAELEPEVSKKYFQKNLSAAANVSSLSHSDTRIE